MWGQIFNLENPLIGAENTWVLWAVVVLGAGLAIYLEQRYTWAAKMTGAVLALIFAIVLSNLGIIPMEASVWDVINGYIVPFAIPLLLLQCDMRKIGKEAGRMLSIFLIGAVGTCVGALVAYFALRNFIPELDALAGVFTGTYVGGGVNFVALSNSFEVSGTMISSATVADNLLMAIYIFVLIMVPSIGFFRRNFIHPYLDEIEANANETKKSEKETDVAAYWSRKEISLKDIAFSVAASFIIVAAANIISGLFSTIIPTDNVVLSILNMLLGNLYLWITTISMCCATFGHGFFGEINGTQEIGTYMIYLFFFAIGIPASIPMVLKNSPLLLIFALIIVAVHMAICFAAAKIFKFTLEDTIVASIANIGGPTGAAAMAISKGWTSLVGPSILVGTLGYVLGTYLGLLVGSILGL